MLISEIYEKNEKVLKRSLLIQNLLNRAFNSGVT